MQNLVNTFQDTGNVICEGERGFTGTPLTKRFLHENFFRDSRFQSPVFNTYDPLRALGRWPVSHTREGALVVLIKISDKNTALEDDIAISIDT